MQVILLYHRSRVLKQNTFHVKLVGGLEWEIWRWRYESTLDETWPERVVISEDM